MYLGLVGVTVAQATNPHTPGNAQLYNQQCLCCMHGHGVIKLYTVTSAVDSILHVLMNCLQTA